MNKNSTLNNKPMENEIDVNSDPDETEVSETTASPEDPTSENAPGPGPAGSKTASDKNPADGADMEKEADSTETASEAAPNEKLAELETESKKNYECFLRVSAEFDNYKKRAARDMTEFKKYATESLIKELLPVLDNLERALQSGKEVEAANQSLIEGVEMTYKEILRILAKFGVSQIEALHQPFDPTYHQAVMREETDAFAENTVTREMQKGYLMHDRLIRPAMVAVAAAAGKTQ